MKGAPTISRREKKLFAAVALTLLVVITVPYLWLAYHTPSGYVFNGVVEAVEDQNVHLSWCKQAADGHFLFLNLFSADPALRGNKPLFINFLWWAVGSLSSLLHVPLVVIYHLARLLFTGLTLWWFYQLCSRLTENKRTRLLSLVLMAFSAGLGWLEVVFPALHPLVMDQASSAIKTEAYAFHTALLYPYGIAPMGFMALTYFHLLRAQDTGRFRHIAVASVAAFFLANTHTYGAPVMALVLVGWCARSLYAGRKAGAAAATESRAGGWYRRSVGWTAPLVISFFLAIPALYQWVIFRLPENKNALDAVTMLAPGAVELALGYGLVGFLGLYGMWRCRRHRESQLIILWAIVTTVMMYMPLPMAGRMIEGLQLPLCYFAAVVVSGWLEKFKARSLQMGLAAALVAVTSLSSLRFVNHVVRQAATEWNSPPSLEQSPTFLTDDEFAAFQFLNDRIPEDQRAATCVFSLPMLGNYVPRYCGARPFAGHWAFTDFFPAKSKFCNEVFAGRITSDMMRTFFKDQAIQYVLWGRYEGLLARQNKFELSPSAWGMKEVWKQGEVAVYQVEGT